MYADVYKDYDYKKQLDSWNIIGESYNRYKNMYETNISYPMEIHGKSKL